METEVKLTKLASCADSPSGRSQRSSQRTQVPQLLLRSRGTGMTRQGIPAPSHSSL